MKRALIFSLAYYPHVGGAEVAIKEITNRIAPGDVEFHLVTMRFSPQEKQEEKIGNVFVYRVGSGTSYLSKILFVPRAARLAQTLNHQKKFDGLWAMMSYMLFPVALARLRLPYVLTLQEGDSYDHMFARLRVFLFLPLLNWGFRHAAVVQAISNYLGGWARKRGFKGPLEVIPNGVDTKHFSSGTARDIGKKSGEVWLIHTGRLVTKNALDTVIEALPFLPPYIHFFSIGTGPDKQKLELLAEKLGVAGRVHFHPFVFNIELSGYLKACDIFVRPSRSEGMGNSFIEAFAAGLPVIATQEGGIADFLFDAKRNPDQQTTGWAVDKNSPEQIAQAVKDILANPEQAQKVVQTARALALAKYDWDLIAKDMKEKVFDRVLLTK
ncbi:MAG: glycosyltransferase family 4 protein [bacterium]|nr:glycosyltransferase family 4 protein [bacterium]